MKNKSLIARTGRVQSWLDDPQSRLPVSCTVFVVDDSMTGHNGIENSWRFVSHALRFGAGVAVHLSKLRPSGEENGKGLTASGPVSFAKIYSTLNEIIRRGGHYKNGACVIHLDINHADVLEFINTPRTELPWVKRCIDLTPELWNDTSREVKDAILQGIKTGDIWLSKIKHDDKGDRIYSNVCLEVYLKSRGTCLLQHVNLAACEYADIPKAFYDGMEELCTLHENTGVDKSGEYLHPEIDRQVGLGMLGLANLLCRFGLTYEHFGHALKRVNDGESVSPEGTADLLAKQLKSGVEVAANVARFYNMERAFCIAPTASCSYKHNDLDGYTATPEIAPPISRNIDRDSGTFGVQSYDYGEVEIAADVGWDAYKLVADELMRMLDATGLLHGYSFNSWSDVVNYNDEFIEDWLVSPQTSLYYALQVMPDTLRKDDASAILDEDYKDIFNLETGNTEEQQYCAACAE